MKNFSAFAIACTFLISGCNDKSNETSADLLVKAAAEKQKNPSISQEKKDEIYNSLKDRMTSSGADKFKAREFWAYDPQDSNSLESGSYFYLSIPTKEGMPSTRLVFRYAGRNWIFWEKIQILADDAIVLNRIFSRNQVARDNSASAVWEVADIEVDDVLAQTAAKIGAAKKVLVRFTGEKTRDYEMSPEEIDNFAKLAEIYEDLRPVQGREILGLPRNSKGGDTYWAWRSRQYENKKDAQKDLNRLKKANINAKFDYIGYSLFTFAAPVRNGRAEAIKDEDVAKQLGIDGGGVYKSNPPSKK